MLSISLASAARRATSVVSLLFGFLLHCSWVLLNGSTVLGRLWSVAVGAFPVWCWVSAFKRGVKNIPLNSRPPIHIDLLPGWNDLILHPYGVLLLAVSLLPLARFLWLGDGAKDSSGARRGPVYAVCVLLFPLALAWSDRLAKVQITNQLDLLAFGSYGALHFASPIIAAWWIWGFGSQGAARIFGWCLGLQNLCGLATHLAFPNAAPWFYDLYGVDAAQPDYSYPGNPAGLYRVDEILGTHIYQKAFGVSPVVFGAVPSLHAATSICCGLFVTRYSKGYRGLVFMVVYCFWMFWATQYLHHHFAIDLLIGTLYAAIAFLVAERSQLRLLDRDHVQRGLTNGWQRLRWRMRDGEGGESVVLSRSTSVSSSEGSLCPSRGMRSVDGYVPVRTLEEYYEVGEIGGVGSDEKV
ncbi:hypothetical protein BCR35DRAFT_308792 [Leucosporidium creatinivorum]|uniref:Inositolphosphotransferase Aur1/Ipt1 domain-containing protein n=1 Tax=Leucosporidium creatinivorum TaxID=106004 RepID=A0A1Y2DXI5_9BASI|nr:hypothetical protein BCR35DRAFT_308792 [Leucosporidium creatinivorum]